ncbi:metallophosphoesterase [Lysinibacillus sp. SGAir0095]|uniref:metallophosphoesterase n=1 Tax=Lysinibacillus sp. SGAir0095 TaxID=2070463 RepID=UPI0010CD338D|nr:metallophosphoesterase [Lysinibacillus sp. SGAir0095]QCR33168.1 YfcE family phosphodiesterase [Lysinibacillus sp. SGAir0095]
MRFLVISDTHGDAEVIKRVREANQDVDAIIHCGDSELSFDHPFLEDVWKVRGNCDRDERFPDEQVFEIGGIKVFVAHGHLLNVKSTIMNLLYRSKEIEANIAFFGHSHVLGAELVDNILFVNPGSLLKPLGITEKSYVIVERSKNTWNVTAYTDKGEKMFTNTYEFTE